MKINIKLENSDYNSIAELMLPGIIKTLAESPAVPMWLKLLVKSKFLVKKISADALMSHIKDVNIEIKVDIQNTAPL